jgi:CRP-like cAMP-binding protein
MGIADTAVPAIKTLKPSRPLPLVAGSRTDTTGKPMRNVLLLSVPDHEYNLLRPELEAIELPRSLILHEPGEKIQFAYFLNDGMTSLVVITNDGRSVEVGVVGHEGMVGAPLAVGLQRGTFRAIMQISGQGVRIRSEILEEALTASPILRQELSRYTLLHGLQVGQIAACNRLHEIDQRLARWLLMCQDRVDSEYLLLTHEFLAQMLGSGRPTVSIAIAALERSGAVENLRGTIKVLNRKQLEKAACECYDVVQNFNGGLGLR